MMGLHFDMHLTQAERKIRKVTEGFGDNSFGSNETVIPPKAAQKYNAEKSNVEILRDGYGIDPILESSIGIFDDDDVTRFHSKNTLPYYTDEPMKHLNKWDTIIDGKIAPSSMPKDFNRNVKSFKIPIMLKTIGFGMPQNNYKLVPMEVFGSCKIIITLNPYAFFVPIRMKEYMYINKDVDKFSEPQAGNGSKPDIGYKVKDIILHCEQYKFPQTIHDKFIDQVKNGGWLLDYVEQEIVGKLNHLFFNLL